MARLELSTQDLDGCFTGSEVSATSRPLYELDEKAPRNPIEYFAHSPVFPFSNDECAAQQFSEVALRRNGEDYQSASNRIAIVVGESSLAACMKWIPEDTIIMLDQSVEMCVFMDNYAAWLRYASSLDDWKDRVLHYGLDKGGLETQIARWKRSGQDHALASEEGFQAAQTIAREKVFVPWQADLSSVGDMGRLGKELSKLGANITFINLTNVVQFGNYQNNFQAFVNNLRQLPVTNYAPILTTSVKPSRPVDTGLAATGPFFGLENLATDGDRRADRYAGAVVTKRFTVPESYDLLSARG